MGVLLLDAVGAAVVGADLGDLLVHGVPEGGAEERELREGGSVSGQITHRGGTQAVPPSSPLSRPLEADFDERPSALQEIMAIPTLLAGVSACLVASMA